MANPGCPKTTHAWLQPLYKWIDGRGTIQPLIGSSTGLIGTYGTTGLAVRLATGVNGSIVGAAGATSLGGLSGFGATGMGNSGFYRYLEQAAFNGGTGNYYNVNDVVTALKNMGVLKA